MHTDTPPQHVPLLIDGQWIETPERVPSCNPFTGKSAFSVCECSDELLDRALAAANEAKVAIGDMPARGRAELLRLAAQGIRRRSESIARTMAIETGKPLTDALTEVLRSAETFELSAQEAVRIEGAQIPMDSSAIGAGKLGVSLRFPVGVVAAITPFNAPVNLTAHKLGPAWAPGNTVVLKPSPQSALTIYRLTEVLLESGIPVGWLQVVQGDRAAARLVASPLVDFITFTGSSHVGEKVKATSGLRRVALELGGNGFTVVAADAPLEEAAQACARNSMRLAGQSCISVQNVLVHRSIYEAFTARVPEVWRKGVDWRSAAPEQVVQRALSMLLQAERPLILAGHGCLIGDAAQALARVSRILGIPVATTPQGKGVLDDQDPLYLGPTGATAATPATVPPVAVMCCWRWARGLATGVRAAGPRASRTAKAPASSMSMSIHPPWRATTPRSWACWPMPAPSWNS